jgi:hypothetical protein
MKENKKLKNLLKKLFENKDLEITFNDIDFTWDGAEYVEEDIVYVFKFRMEVSKVLGEGSRSVGGISVIIDDITKDGEDYYYNWAESGYTEIPWYIRTLEHLIKEEYFEDLPFSIHLTFYGYDEQK